MNKALRYLGLAARAGKIIVGAEECGKEVPRRREGLLIVASNAAANTLRLARDICAGRGAAPFSAPYTKEELGWAMGRANPVALAYICDEGLANAFAAAAESDREQEERV